MMVDVRREASGMNLSPRFVEVGTEQRILEKCPVLTVTLRLCGREK